eukprot:TRINITY_DN25556_c0_g1_i3.p1 TRINITY_DN25556_c0_g1~~TRINITY_DN25556_c0_g1_i3.p1  ORF type:complete len:334 (+),score=66.25 TRINITY_DN25556_c0_g1_i3:113-1114(+)
MLRSLVGSEMCIRDRYNTPSTSSWITTNCTRPSRETRFPGDPDLMDVSNSLRSVSMLLESVSHVEEEVRDKMEMEMEIQNEAEAETARLNKLRRERSRANVDPSGRIMWVPAPSKHKLKLDEKLESYRRMGCTQRARLVKHIRTERHRERGGEDFVGKNASPEIMYAQDPLLRAARTESEHVVHRVSAQQKQDHLHQEHAHKLELVRKEQQQRLRKSHQNRTRLLDGRRLRRVRAEARSWQPLLALGARVESWARSMLQARRRPKDTLNSMLRSAALSRARKKFDSLDADSNGVLRGEELLALSRWLWDSFHPDGEPLSAEQQQSEGDKLLRR